GDGDPGRRPGRLNPAAPADGPSGRVLAVATPADEQQRDAGDQQDGAEHEPDQRHRAGDQVEPGAVVLGLLGVVLDLLVGEGQLEVEDQVAVGDLADLVLGLADDRAGPRVDPQGLVHAVPTVDPLDDLGGLLVDQHVELVGLQTLDPLGADVLG